MQPTHDQIQKTIATHIQIHKTIWRIKQVTARIIALQFPEGLFMYACIISDILERFADVTLVFILGDVTFGACCVDDYSAASMGADMLIHYGHSCLVPLDVTSIPCLYVFVDIVIDLEHLVASVELNFKPHSKIILAGTIQVLINKVILKVMGITNLSRGGPYGM